ncbi:hypothetical protein PN473_03225 [Dolichospermum circinale CS-545/17]|jgi:hypothetical protein|nr:hypothetical protein [Dolichospermum circinale CS-545/17]
MKFLKTLLVCGSLLNSLVFAETLIAPPFPDQGTWQLVIEQPLTDPDKKVVGKMAFFGLSANDAQNPKDNTFLYEMDRQPSASPVDYANNHALAIQQQCESSQITRPTHTLEKRVPVSYLRAFCTKIKSGDSGFVQSIKILQGKEKMFMVVRQWTTTPFSFDPTVQNRMQFAKSIFKSDATATEWIAQADAVTKHFENAVTLCSNKQGEFGEPCSLK